MTEDNLTAARIILKDAAASRARLEWRTKLGDSEALNVRRMTQEIINTGNQESLEALAKYYGVQLFHRKGTILKNADGVFVTALGNGQLVAVKIEKV